VVWLIAWLIYYRRPEQHRSVSKAELELILSDPAETLESVPWSRVFPRKETWASRSRSSSRTHLVVLFVLDSRLSANDLSPESAAKRVPVVLAYSISIVGSIGGGIFPR